MIIYKFENFKSFHILSSKYQHILSYSNIQITGVRVFYRIITKHDNNNAIRKKEGILQFCIQSYTKVSIKSSIFFEKSDHIFEFSNSTKHTQKSSGIIMQKVSAESL